MPRKREILTPGTRVRLRSTNLWGEIIARPTATVATVRWENGDEEHIPWHKITTKGVHLSLGTFCADEMALILTGLSLLEKEDGAPLERINAIRQRFAKAPLKEG